MLCWLCSVLCLYSVARHCQPIIIIAIVSLPPVAVRGRTWAPMSVESEPPPPSLPKTPPHTYPPHVHRPVPISPEPADVRQSTPPRLFQLLLLLLTPSSARPRPGAWRACIQITDRQPPGRRLAQKETRANAARTPRGHNCRRRNLGGSRDRADAAGGTNNGVS